MILERGNMWDRLDKDHEFIVTTNRSINKRGLAVMGAGAAKAAAMLWPRAPEDLAFAIKHSFSEYFGGINAYPTHVENRYIRLYFFMVKEHWRDNASLDMIANSVSELIETVDFIGPDRRWNLNFPGIGNGKLPREEVLPIISELPDNVHVWEYE